MLSFYFYLRITFDILEFIIQEKMADDTRIKFQLSFNQKNLELAMTQPLYLYTELNAGIPIFCTENK